MIPHRRDFEETKYMSFLIRDDELLEQYDKIWDKVRNSMKKGFDSEPVYNEKYLKTKTKSYDENISTNFYCDKVPKEGSQCIFLSIIFIDSVLEQVKAIILKYF